MYVTHVDLVERPGARELAEVATAQHEQMVPYELMEQTLLGGDRGAWSEEEIERADAALSRIDDARLRAGQLIDGYLAKRGYLPLTEPAPGIVVEWCRAIARYFLHQDRISDEKSDPIVRDYRDALKLLQQTADGKFHLGADDPLLTNPSAVDVRFESSPSVFNRSELGRFR